MTIAPACLLEARRFLYTNLDLHPDSSGYSSDLDPAELGIVGDAAHVGEGNSYHLGLPEQSLTGYAATESPRDKAGLCEFASALDIGGFSISIAGKSHNLRSFSIWLVAQCKAGAPDTLDIREIIYSPDGATVKRWDRLGKRTSGDDSHLWHTHISYFRDATKANRSQVGLFQRYLIYIGLLEDPDMAITTNDAVIIWTHDLQNGDGEDPAYRVLNRAAIEAAAGNANAAVARTEAAAARAEAIKARLAAEATLAAVKGLDTNAVLARVNEVGAQLSTEVANVDEAVAERLGTTDLDTLVQILDAAGVDRQALAAKLTTG